MLGEGSWGARQPAAWSPAWSLTALHASTPSSQALLAPIAAHWHVSTQQLPDRQTLTNKPQHHRGCCRAHMLERRHAVQHDGPTWHRFKSSSSAQAPRTSPLLKLKHKCTHKWDCGRHDTQGTQQTHTCVPHAQLHTHQTKTPGLQRHSTQHQAVSSREPRPAHDTHRVYACCMDTPQALAC